ncbi:hypothetical protein D081_1538 [Anaerovibrio sp. JC8]|uniref:hypothetical protein n=1 Tax=Anaerovibrio sp. JC8 TaxID=1240085 RepID=UPI000A0BDA57|nr:hypothetical protein [Anaerovibrio sp. JC8]ORT99957.1 hypothetical protein D081_1538 [Anaerovibrio sp. JC8]
MMVRNNSMVSMLWAGSNLSKYEGTLAEKLQQAREDEMKQMNRAVDSYQNLHVDNTKKILGGVKTGELDPNNIWKNNEPYIVEISDQAMALYLEKKTIPGVDPTAEPATLPKVTSIDSAHYRWTEETGIVEKMTIEEEIVQRREHAEETVQKELSGSVNNLIGQILQPYDTYEEAEQALYLNTGAGTWTSYDEDYNVVYQMNKNGEAFSGLFGQLANTLNNYLDVFGKDNDFFSKLSSALDKIDDGNNSLIKQIRSMVETVSNGERIDTESADYQESVRKAVADYWEIETPTKGVYVKKNDKHKGPEQSKGLSSQELELMSLKEDKKLLDKMFGNKEEQKPDTTARNLLNRAWENESNRQQEEAKLQNRRLNSDDEQNPPTVKKVQKEMETETEGIVHLVDPDVKLEQQTLSQKWHSIAVEFGWEQEI